MPSVMDAHWRGRRIRTGKEGEGSKPTWYAPHAWFEGDAWRGEAKEAQQKEDRCWAKKHETKDDEHHTVWFGVLLRF
jgi:hypothetical protein